MIWNKVLLTLYANLFPSPKERRTKPGHGWRRKRSPAHQEIHQCPNRCDAVLAYVRHDVWVCTKCHTQWEYPRGGSLWNFNTPKLARPLWGASS